MILPEPLSKEEQEVCMVEFYQKGNKEARLKLIEGNMRLITLIAKRYQNIEIEEAISIGSIGLIKGVDNFDITKKIKLTTYASKCIENEFLMYIRRNKKNEMCCSLEEMVFQEGFKVSRMDTGLDMLEDITINIEEDVIQIQEVLFLYEVIGKLNSFDRFILTLRYGLYGYIPCTQREIAGIIGVGRAYVTRMEERALRFANLLATGKIDRVRKKKEIVILGNNINGKFELRDLENEITWIRGITKGISENDILFLFKKGFTKEEILAFYLPNTQQINTALESFYCKFKKIFKVDVFDYHNINDGDLRLLTMKYLQNIRPEVKYIPFKRRKRNQK